jgi:hypothetical protein
MAPEQHRPAAWSYATVALVAFLIGMALGQLGAVRGALGSRISWPAPAVLHPRSLQP